MHTLTLVDCFPEWLDQIIFPPPVQENAHLSTSSSTFRIIHLANFCHSYGQKILFYCFNFNFLDYKWFWTFLYNFSYTHVTCRSFLVYFEFVNLRCNFYHNLLNSFSNLKKLQWKLGLEGSFFSIGYQTTSILGSNSIGPYISYLLALAWFGYFHRVLSSTLAQR